MELEVEVRWAAAILLVSLQLHTCSTNVPLRGYIVRPAMLWNSIGKGVGVLNLCRQAPYVQYSLMVHRAHGYRGRRRESRVATYTK